MIHYIYLTTNLINGKQYIGQHKGELDDSYLGSGTAIKKALQKYGSANFQKEILEICTPDNVDERERYWITYYNAVEDDNFYNLQEGGTGGDGWRCAQKWMKEHPEEAQRIYQENGRHLRQWMEEHPEQARQNTMNWVQAGYTWWRNHPEELNQHMKEVNIAKEKWQQENPEKHQLQVQEWIKAGSIANSKKIICLNTNEIFDSISAAGRAYNVPQPNISKVLSGERKSAGRHPETNERLRWAYAGEVTQG